MSSHISDSFEYCGSCEGSRRDICDQALRDAELLWAEPDFSEAVSSPLGDTVRSSEVGFRSLAHIIGERPTPGWRDCDHSLAFLRDRLNRLYQDVKEERSGDG